MGRPLIVNCKKCGRPLGDPNKRSWTKQCPSCGETAQLDNRRQLMAHQGPYFDHWRRQLAASVGATLDAPRPRA